MDNQEKIESTINIAIIVAKYLLLTGYEIDVYRNTEEAEMEDDVDLKEFVDEIDEWIIDSLRNMGCDTAKSVLAYTAEEIATRADLEIETVVEILEIFKAEFEDDDQ